MSTFTDKVVIVTGASEGIGRAFCVALAPQRPKLVISARNVERLESLKTDVEALGANVLLVQCDVTDESACKALVYETVKHFGAIDVLVNNAGGTMWTTMEEMENTDIYRKLMDLNYLGSVYPTFYALPHLIKSKGRLVAVASVAGLCGVPTRTAYSASKHAVFGLFDSLRIELMGKGVSVTIIAPDFVVTEIHRRALGPDGKPLGESPMQESKIMGAEACATMMVDAIAKRKRLMLTSARSRFVRLLKIFAPSFLDKLALKTIKNKK